jgi:hypothetical protein
MPIRLNKTKQTTFLKVQGPTAEACWPEVKRPVANRNKPFTMTEDTGKIERKTQVIRDFSVKHEESLRQEDYSKEIGRDETLGTIIINLEDNKRTREN